MTLAFFTSTHPNAPTATHCGSAVTPAGHSVHISRRRLVFRHPDHVLYPGRLRVFAHDAENGRAPGAMADRRRCDPARHRSIGAHVLAGPGIARRVPERRSIGGVIDSGDDVAPG